ncbi:class I SAM-dependent methyltransferase [Ornithinicoccus halotolerans]|uniref:class I SAM-dependent methyltransferase n=1 Tax=Ornithinicoccus halotolerans TaxID=1748220 RepID=UPI001297EB9C|nr:class I SAM-dependent methyltransferase [Ornithinicoccus halotolerans]
MTITEPQARPGHPLPPAAEAPALSPEQAADRLMQIWTEMGTGLLLALADRTSLLETLAERGPSTSAELAQAAGLQERYVREVLDGLFVSRLLSLDTRTRRYAVPEEFVPVLTSAGGPDNMVRLMRYAELATVLDKVEQAARHGGGTSYADYAHFQELQAEDSGAVFEATLLDQVVPLVPDLPERLEGIEVVDLGCGRGRAVTLLAEAYPQSRFTGMDFSAEAVQFAQADAAARGLANAEFRLQDVARWDEPGRYDLVTAFDAIHDQADPAAVLRAARQALRSGGTFLMVDIAGSSQPEGNLELPWAPMLYAVSVLHCMAVSLGQDGLGLGTMWGRQQALQMLAEAGFRHIDPIDVEEDPFNTYYVARP